MVIYSQPYTYLIGWSKHRTFYYGARWAENCSPADLWSTYFTSSKAVGAFRQEHGEPDIIEVRGTFASPEAVRLWEHKVLRRLKVRKRPDFLNKTDGLCPSTKGIKMPPMSAEARAKISKANSGRKMAPRTPEYLAKLSASTRGKKKRPSGPRKQPRSHEHCLKISRSKTGVKLGPNNPQTPERKAELAARRAILGPIVQRRIICPYCGTVGGAAAMPRWHFDNCKSLIHNT